MVDPDRGVGGDLHAAAGHHGRQRGAARDPRGPRRQLQRPAVGDRRLCAVAGGARARGGLARGPARPPAGVRGRPGHLHAGLAALRRRAGPAVPEPGPRGPGDRRRGDVRGLARADRAGVRARPRARQRDGHLRRDDRRRRRARPARRRRPDRLARLGVDLPAQPADRDRGARADLPARGREPRPARDARRRRGRDDVQRRPLPARARARARERRGLGQRADPGPVRRSRRAARRVRRGRDAQPRADAAARAVPPAGVHRRPARGVRDLGLRLRTVPLPDAVHAEPARPDAVRGRTALPAADARGVRRLAGRRAAAPARPGPAAAGRRVSPARASACC